MASSIRVYRRRYRGFPKRLPCLVCGKLRTARSPSVRIHAACRRARLAQVAAEFIELTALISTEEVIY